MSQNKPSRRPEKKSETIEVRVSYSEKLAFMEACKQAGTTASHAIRGYIGNVLDPANTHQSRRARMWTAIGFATIVSLVGVIVWQSQQDSQPTTGERILSALDLDRDGRLSMQDADLGSATEKATIQWLIEAADQNGDAVASYDEIASIANVTIELRGKEQTDALQRRENVIIVPPGLSETERQAFIDEAATKHHIREEDIQRLIRLIEALTANTDY